MASIYPRIPQPRTIGEKQLIEFLKATLDDSWIIFYEPLIANRQPDFLLFNDQYGILVLEVKDYRKDTIISISPNDWVIKGDGGTLHLSSPFLQARNYAFTVINFLAKEPELINNKLHIGKLKIPVIPLCAFTNLTEHDITSLGINRVIPMNSIVTSRFIELNKIELQEKLHHLFEEYFLIPQLSELETNLVKSKLYPEMQIESQRPVADKVISHTNETLYIPKRSGNESSVQLFFFLSSIFSKEIVLRGSSKNNELLFDVTKFDSIINELLFVSTEIRHLYASGERDLHKIAVVFYKNRNILKTTLANQAISVISEMGIPLEERITEEKKVKLLSFEQFKRAKTTFTYVFMIDFNQIRGEEMYNKILTTIKEVSIQKFTYISFNSESNLTKKINSSWNMLLN